MELAIKETVTNLLNNPIFTALMTTGTYSPDSHTTITLEGAMKFEVSLKDGNIIVAFDDLRPKVSYSPFVNMKRFAKMDGRLRSLTISPSKIVIALDGLPDQSVLLT